MKLQTINSTLGFFGLVLVVSIGANHPTAFKLMRVISYRKLLQRAGVVASVADAQIAQPSSALRN
jgi:hypothetical protein